ncbi:Ger(x)C family spore germination protein [Halobacillus litoralis]|uniref:Ger(X)C family spore germination protein n=1 Tax=Halobacillus litoralis TaxID=45668 RepID=A0A410MAS5_9BACI|nr:Ger(x)C family spore germination protein [Halobacillus litoralis]QAS51780.1 Ger(x)C family spore germination protein [Halobacillus litoralis]
MKKAAILLMVMIFLAGCIPKNYIERLGIITAVGYDLIEDDRLRGTLVMFQFDPTAANNSQVVTGEAETSKGIRFATNRLTSQQLVSGQVRLEIFQDQLASKGMMKYMDTLQRDAKISDMGYLAVSNVPTSTMLKSNNSESHPNTGNYIQQLIEKSIKDESIPNAVLTGFMHDFYDTGKDPVLPLLTLEEDKTVIQGLGLFQDDRFVDAISHEQTFYLMLMKQEFDHGQFQIELDSDSMQDFYRKSTNEQVSEGDLHVSLHELSTERTIKPTKGQPTKQSVHLKMESRLLEITKEIELKDKKAINALEKELEIAIEKKLGSIMTIFKEAQVDPVGFGAKYNTEKRSNRVTNENWREQIPELDIEFKVDFKLLRYGITE